MKGQFKDLLKVKIEKSTDYQESTISYDKEERISDEKLGNPEYILSYKLEGMATCMSIKFGSKSDLELGAREASKVKLTNASGILSISERAEEVDVKASLKRVRIEKSGEISGEEVNDTKKSSTLKTLSQSRLDQLSDDEKYEYLENEMRGFNFFQDYMSLGKPVEYFDVDDGADTWSPEWYLDSIKAIKDVRKQMGLFLYLGIIDARD